MSTALAHVDTLPKPKAVTMMQSIYTQATGKKSNLLKVNGTRTESRKDHSTLYKSVQEPTLRTFKPMNLKIFCSFIT